MTNSKKTSLSFIVPAMNEEDTLRTLFNGIRSNCVDICSSFEIIFIDDGSSDRTWQVMEELTKEFPSNVKAIQHRKNFGKANALSVGYREATGDFVFTMDADLQDEPSEIPRFLEKIEADNLDIVSGYKQTRHDPWHKVLPSRVFNKIISHVGGVKLHDHNCGFKCYRNEVVKVLPMYGGMHRMVPSIAGIFGFKTGEIVVQHNPREFGQSKYGVKRFFDGIADIITIGFIKRYREQPNHALAIVSLIMAVAAITLSGGMSLLAFPALIISTMTIVSTAALTAGFVLFFLGILAEVEVWRSLLPSGENHISHQIGNANPATPPTTVRKIIGKKKALVADDDPRVNQLITKLLKKDDWDVVNAISAQDAIDKIDDDISVAFIDVHMPGPEHSDTIKRIHQKTSGTRIISFSGDRDEQLPEKVANAGAAFFLPKPVNRAELIDQANIALSDLEHISLSN